MSPIGMGNYIINISILVKLAIYQQNKMAKKQNKTIKKEKRSSERTRSQQKNYHSSTLSRFKDYIYDCYLSCLPHISQMHQELPISLRKKLAIQEGLKKFIDFQNTKTNNYNGDFTWQSIDQSISQNFWIFVFNLQTLSYDELMSMHKSEITHHNSDLSREQLNEYMGNRIELNTDIQIYLNTNNAAEGENENLVQFVDKSQNNQQQMQDSQQFVGQLDELEIRESHENQTLQPPLVQEQTLIRQSNSTGGRSIFLNWSSFLFMIFLYCSPFILHEDAEQYQVTNFTQSPKKVIQQIICKTEYFQRVIPQIFPFWTCPVLKQQNFVFKQMTMSESPLMLFVYLTMYLVLTLGCFSYVVLQYIRRKQIAVGAVE